MESSGTTSRAAILKWSFCRSSATAGPERSSRSPRAQESLTVITAAVRTCGSAIEEDIFLFIPSRGAGSARRCRHNGRRWRSGHRCGRSKCRRSRSKRILWWSCRWCGCCSGLRLPAAVARRFVEQPQPFHQQALGVELRRLFVGLTFEIELEISACPTKNFEHSLVAHQRSVSRVLHLAVGKKYFAFI